MSYSLRPENKLKAPKRFRDTFVEAEDLPELKTTNPDTVGSLPLPIKAVPRTLGAQHSTFPSPPEQPTMANIKIIKQRKRMRTEEPDGYDSTVRPRSGRTVKVRKDSALELPPDNLMLRPAAFPSLPTNIPPPLPTVVEEFEGHGMKELVDAMIKDDKERVFAIHTHFAQMYATSTEAWYSGLRERWSPNESDTTVQFKSLWPSLRQVIIDEIQQEMAGAGYTDTFYPVQCLLKMTREELFNIIAKNGQVWESTDDIPLYYRQLKRDSQDVIIDPDQPPPAQVVRAIKFLKQERLPGGLLGEWSTLPSEEAFAESPEVERYHSDIVIAIESSESSEAIVMQQEREHQDRLEEMVRQGKIASREKDRLCTFCRRKGHLHNDIDRDGLLVCPVRRLNDTLGIEARNSAQFARLHEAAEFELAEIRHKDRLAAAQLVQPSQLPQQQPFIQQQPFHQWPFNQSQPLDQPSPFNQSKPFPRQQPFNPGPNSPRTKRIFKLWQNGKDWNALMADPVFQHHTGSRRIYKQTREQYSEQLWREGDKHPGMKVNQPPYSDVVKALNAAYERQQNGGMQIQDYSNTSTTSASASASASVKPRTTVCPARILTTFLPEPVSPPLPPAGRTSAAALPMPSSSTAMPPPTSLSSTTPDQHQSQGQPQARKKRGPYKKKPVPAAGTSTTPASQPPTQRINRRGLVSLAPPPVPQLMASSTAAASTENGHTGGAGNGSTSIRDENANASPTNHRHGNAQGKTHATTPANSHTHGPTRTPKSTSSDTIVVSVPAPAPDQTQLPTPPLHATFGDAKACPTDEDKTDTDTE